MKRLLTILMCLFLIIGTAPAQRRDGQHRKPRTTTVQNRPGKQQPKPVVKKPKYDKHPHKHHPRHIPYDVMPYRMRRHLNKHYHGHSIVRYILKSNPGYIDGHDCYYEVYLSNGVILLFSTNYNIIH